MARSDLTKISLRVTLYTRKLVRTERNIFKFAVGSIYPRNRRIIISRGNIRETEWSISISLLFIFRPCLLSPLFKLVYRIKKKKKEIIGQVSTSSTGLVGLTPSSLSNSSRSIRVRYIALNGDGKYD